MHVKSNSDSLCAWYLVLPPLSVYRIKEWCAWQLHALMHDQILYMLHFLLLHQQEEKKGC